MQFRSFFQGGFECSTHRLQDGKRVDVIAATGHDRWASSDYSRLAEIGIRTVRDGLRWHRIERRPGFYDWSSVLPMLRAARATRMQVIWDLLHYGWPDDLDLFAPAFIDRFIRFAQAAIRVIRDESDEAPLIVPVNEISYTAWAAGEFGHFHPFGRGQGDAAKLQLVRAAIGAMTAMRAVAPASRFVIVDPMIHVVANPARPETALTAARYREAQFTAWDMIAGKLRPDLGGSVDFMDVIGINYYCHNQWMVDGQPLPWNGRHPDYVPFSRLLRENHARYGRPILIAETGIEDEVRPRWLRHVCEFVAHAMVAGVPVRGICLYPVLNHPGWADDRHCHNGLLDYEIGSPVRRVYQPLADELLRQQPIFAELLRREAEVV